MSIIRETINYEKCMGNIFYEIINHFFPDKISSIVEFAPGFRSKISYALEKINYDGDLYIIDSNEKVLKYVKSNYSKIIPKANIITINLDLIDSLKVLPKNIDLFLSNHCIDDMIIGKYIEMKNLQSLFDNNSSTYELLNNCWIELDNNKKLLDTIISNAYEDLSCLFNSVNFKMIIINNYKSWFYLKIKNIPEFYASKIFELLKCKFNHLYDIDKILNKIDFNDDEELNNAPSIDENILNSDNWIVGSFNNL